MKLVTTPIRSALATLLSGIPFMGKTINAFEGYLQESTTKKKAVLTVGNQQVTAYIILLNQTANENSTSKCVRNDESSIQIQVTTIFPADTGGSLIAEQIAQLAIDRIMPVDNRTASGVILPEPFNIWSAKVVSIRPIDYNTDTSRVWIIQLTLNFSIIQ